MFDFLRFVQDYNIPHRTKGENTQEGWVNICCTNNDCNDPDFHLGYDLKKNYLSCWKCGKKYLEDIIESLLPYENSKDIIKKYTTEYQTYIKTHKKLNKTKVNKIKLPGNELKPIHTNYLQKRGYNVVTLVDRYKIKGTLDIGKYPYRIIIPIYYNNELVTYQTRTIRKSDKSKYINCDPENEIIPIKETLYNYGQCRGNYVIVTEGVMKVWKLQKNVVATFGKNFTNKQIELLLKFEYVFMFFDPDEAGKKGAKKLTNILNNLGKKVFNIEHEKAPDELNQQEVGEIYEGIESII
jgi:5S rRNA maturation endonuclease (ribonuclease M5)